MTCPEVTFMGPWARLLAPKDTDLGNGGLGIEALGIESSGTESAAETTSVDTSTY